MNCKKVTIILLYSFMLLVPLLNNFKIKVGVIPISIDVILGLLIIIFGLIYSVKEYKKDREFIKVLYTREIKIVLVSALAFGVISLLSIFVAENKAAVISEFMRLLEYVLLFVIILLIANEDFLNNSMKLFLFSMCIAALVGVAQYYFDLPNVYEVGEFKEGGRIYSTFVNPNYWGAAVNLIIFLPIVNIIEKRKCNKYINLLILVLFAFNLIFAYTRGAWVGFFVGIVIVFLICYRKGLITVPIAIAFLAIQPQTRNRFLSMFNSSDWTSTQRLRLWKIGLKIFQENFWTGIGNGNWKYVYRDYVKENPNLYPGRTIMSSHNSYIKTLAELGIFGGIAFIALYGALLHTTYYVYKNTIKYRVYAIAFLGFWGAYLFQNFFNNLIFIPQLNVFVWILTAMLYKGLYLEKSNDKVTVAH